MRKLFGGFGLTFMVVMGLSAFVVGQAIAWSPSPPRADSFDLAQRLSNTARDGVVHTTRHCVDFAGAASAASGQLLGGVIPADSLVVENYYVVTQAFDSSATARLNFGCDSANDLFADLDLNGDATSSYGNGVADNDGVRVYVDDQCQINYSLTGLDSDIVEGQICIYSNWVKAQ